MIQQKQIDHWFKYHPPVKLEEDPENAGQMIQVPDNEKISAYAEVRSAGRDLAAVILKNTPSSPDQSAAIRKVREAVMTANASIACGGR